MCHLRLVHSNTWLAEAPRPNVEYEVPPFDPMVQKLIDLGRIMVPVPRFVRARAMARARAAIATPLFPPHATPASATSARLIMIGAAPAPAPGDSAPPRQSAGQKGD